MRVRILARSLVCRKTLRMISDLTQLAIVPVALVILNTFEASGKVNCKAPVLLPYYLHRFNEEWFFNSFLEIYLIFAAKIKYKCLCTFNGCGGVI